MNGRRSVGLAAVAAAVAGCGGGQGSAQAVSGQAHLVKSGDAVITYFGQPRPQFSTSSSYVSVLGQAGATFSNVTLEPPPNLANTYLVFSREVGSELALYELPYSAANGPTLLYQNDSSNTNPAISAYGTVAFNTASYGMESIRPDATGLKPIAFTGLNDLYQPAYAMDGTNRLAFLGFNDLNTDLYIGPGTGGAPTELQSNSSVGGNLNTSGEAWNPTGTQLAFTVSRPPTGLSDIFTAAPTTNAPITDVTPLSLQYQYVMLHPSWSSDGQTIVAAAENDSSGESGIFTFNVNSGAYSILSPASYNDKSPCFSPDGSKIAFFRDTNGGATPGIYICDAAGGNQSLIAADPSGQLSVGGLSWSPFLPKETVIGASGSTFFHQSASGFLISQNGSQFGSVMAFTAATPSAASIQAPASSSGDAPLQFTITADAITSIGYINNYFSPGTTISLSSTPSALVSIDAYSGQVDLVAPSNFAKVSTTENADGTVSYKAPFKALYDAKGKNLAPNGASSLTMDPKTGRLLAFR